MTHAFDSRLGELLYSLLPEVYRTRDRKAKNAGGKESRDDLAKYLDAQGFLLDLIHATLEQQNRDILPGSSQDWLLPYFARLLAANIVSPDSKGKHAEVANAVSWRQRKGTLKCIEEIAEAVGQMEVEIQEGWKRVAMTPHMNMPLMSAKVWDNTLELDMQIPSQAARHPSLPATMVDLRRASRSVSAKKNNPAARVSKIGGVRHTWRQDDSHGLPCFPNAFDDVSRRTVDIRTPSAKNGHYHHKRLLIYVPPPEGFFPLPPEQLTWSAIRDSKYEYLIEVKDENGVRTIRNLGSRPIEITDDAVLNNPDLVWHIEGLTFNTRLVVNDGSRVRLSRVTAQTAEVNISSLDEPVLEAADCLFKDLSVGVGAAVINSCTVLGTAFLAEMDAKDCIFMNISGSNITGAVQYSRIPVNAPFDGEDMIVQDCTTDTPRFFNLQTGLPAMAVTAPGTPQSIYAGAFDGGEMGVYHNGRADRPVILKGNFTGAEALVLPAESGYPLKDLIFSGDVEVNAGPLTLLRCAMKSLQVNTPLLHDARGNGLPSLDAKDCLLDTLAAGSALARLEYCTIMKTADCAYLQASDCIFAGSVVNLQVPPGPVDQQPLFYNCLRFSAIPDNTAPYVLAAFNLKDAGSGSNTFKKPVFTETAYCTNKGPEVRTALYGEPGYGVLASTSPDAVCSGAEDGGEMGGCHHKFYCLRFEAVLEKMREFLPVGIEPVLVRDARLMLPWPDLAI